MRLTRSKREKDVDTSSRAVAIALAAGRIAIGAGLWLAPGLTLRGLGFGEPDGRTLALARIAGTRDLVLASWQLASLDDPRQLRWATLGVTVSDAGDALVFGFAVLTGSELRVAGLRGLAGALPATLAGTWLARRLRA